MDMNKTIIKQMIRLSSIIKKTKEARCKSSLILDEIHYFIVKGEVYSDIEETCKTHISRCLYIEKHLQQTIREACKFLDGFDANAMDPIHYISSSDVKNKRVDICRGEHVVATIDLTTGIINPLLIEKGEDKSSVEKS